MDGFLSGNGLNYILAEDPYRSVTPAQHGARSPQTRGKRVSKNNNETFQPTLVSRDDEENKRLLELYT
jgi:hypothetical protein